MNCGPTLEGIPMNRMEPDRPCRHRALRPAMMALTSCKRQIRGEDDHLTEATGTGALWGRAVPPLQAVSRRRRRAVRSGRGERAASPRARGHEPEDRRANDGTPEAVA